MAAASVDLKKEYEAVTRLAKAGYQEWLDVFRRAKTPETMARAWIFLFKKMEDRPLKALKLAIASLRYGYASSIFDLIDEFAACDKNRILDFRELQLALPLNLTGEERAQTIENQDPFEFAGQLISLLEDLSYLGMAPPVKGLKIIDLIVALRICFIQFVSERFADKYSAAAIQNSLRMFYYLLNNRNAAKYAMLQGTTRQKLSSLIYFAPDQKKFHSELHNCLRRAVAKQPNWGESPALKKVMETTETVQEVGRYRYLEALRHLDSDPQRANAIYELIEKCLFPELYGPPPRDFFENYFLHERTGNYIRFDQVNESTTNGDTKDAKNAAAPLQLETASGSAAAAAYQPTNFEAAAAPAVMKYGGWSPLGIPVLF